MNEYRITFATEGCAFADCYITERSENAAKKAFAIRYKGKHYSIQHIELNREGVSATKEQERDTLEAIRKMVEELGPQSYLATAFEGCFADAESNIENDFGDSMQRRWESAVEKLSALQEENNRLKAELADRTLKEQLAAAQEQITALRRQQLPEQLRRDLWMMTTNEAEASRVRMAEAADKMAVGADNPGCVLFKESVARYRAEKTRAESMEQMADALDALDPER